MENTMAPYKISLAAARVNACMTQGEVAEIMHISKQTIVNWENGKIIPKPAQLKFMCELYGAPTDIIFLQQKLTKS